MKPEKRSGKNLVLAPDGKRFLPRAPLKLASMEDVSRYLTTISRMLHDDLITPQKATALRGLCEAKIRSLKENQDTGTKVQINIGVPMGTKAEVKSKEANAQSIDIELQNLEEQIAEELNK